MKIIFISVISILIHQMLIAEIISINDSNSSYVRFVKIPLMIRAPAFTYFITESVPVLMGGDDGYQDYCDVLSSPFKASSLKDNTENINLVSSSGISVKLIESDNKSKIFINAMQFDSEKVDGLALPDIIHELISCLKNNYTYDSGIMPLYIIISANEPVGYPLDQKFLLWKTSRPSK